MANTFNHNDKVVITDGGSVGIGKTSSISAPLNVFSASTTNIAIFENNGTSIAVKIGDSSNSNYANLVLTSNSGNAQVWKAGTAYTDWGGALSLNIYNSNGAIAFHPNNTANAMFINTSGNVGIGTTSPHHKLHVDGSVASKRAASTTALNGQFLVFWDSTYPTSRYLYGMDLGYNGTYRTRIFSPSDYDIALSSAPALSMGAQSDYTDHLVVKGSTGNVGIGTTSPSYKLQVNGPSNNIIASFDHTSFVSRQVGLPGRFMVGPLGNGYPEIGYNFTTASSTYTKIVNDTSWSINFGNDSRMSFKYAGAGTGEFSFTEHMIINTTGNVGIGTTSPSSILQVGAGSFSATSSAYKSIDAGAAGILFRNAYDAYLTFNTTYSASGWVNKYSSYKSGVVSVVDGKFQVDLGTGTTAGAGSSLSNKFTILNNGKVGIGTTSPTNTKVHIVGNGSYVGNYGYNTLTLEDTSGYPGLNLRQGNNNWLIRNDGGNQSLQFVFSSNASAPGTGTYSPLLNITSSGNVGIGTTSPASQLEVSGATLTQLKVTESGSSVTTMIQSSTSYGWVGTKTNHTMYIGTNDGAKITVLSGGNVGIGTTSASYKLDVSGGIRATDYFISSAGATIGGQGPNDWVFLGPQGDAASRAAAVMIGDINGAKYAVYGGNYDLTFAKHRSDTDTFHSALTILGSSTTDSSPDVYITNSLGIGTNSPSQKLSVYGNIYLRGSDYITWSNGDAQIDSTSYHLRFHTYDGVSALVERMRITSGGNVGFGTTSPSYKIDVSGGAIAIRGNAAGNSLRFDDTTATSRNAMYVDSSNYLNIGNSNYAGVKFVQTASAPTAGEFLGIQIQSAIGVTDEGVVLAAPDAWLAVRVGTTDYAIPMYTTG